MRLMRLTFFHDKTKHQRKFPSLEEIKFFFERIHLSIQLDFGCLPYKIEGFEQTCDINAGAFYMNKSIGNESNQMTHSWLSMPIIHFSPAIHQLNSEFDYPSFVANR